MFQNMHGPRLPQELVDNIIDILHHDNESLEECALVTRSWTRSCRRYIFNHITIDLALEHSDPILLGRVISTQETGPNDECMDATDLLLQAFSTASYLPSYIECLTLKMHPPTQSNSASQANLEKIIHTLSQLTSLRSVTLFPRQWSKQPPALRRACLECINNPTVTSVKLYENQFPASDILSILSELTSTSCLELNGVMALDVKRPYEKGFSVATPLAATLRTLRICSPGMLAFSAMWLSSIPDSCRRLESVEVDCFVIAPRVLQNLLDACPGLMTFTIVSHMNIPEWPNLFLPDRMPLYGLNLSVTPQLRELRLVRIALTQETDRVPWVLSLFAVGSTPLSLSRIVLDFELENPSETVLRSMQPLDLFFSGSQFPCLQRLTVRSSMSGLKAEETEATALLIRTQFPILLERNVLEVACVAK